eukprot:tig00000248_g21796.t1
MAWKRREEKRQARLERKLQDIEKHALEWGFRYDHPKELLRDVEIEMARAAPEKKPLFEALRDSVLQYIHTMYQPIFTCDCCSIRDYVDELYTVDAEDSYTLAVHGITQEHIDRIAKDPEDVGRHPRLCSACHHFRANPEQGKPICPLSRQNGVHPTPPSQKLADLARELTLPESLAVRTVVPFVPLCSSPGSAQEAARATVVLLRSHPQHVLNAVEPMPPKNVMMYVNMQKPTAPTADPEFTGYWKFDVDRVRATMDELVAAGNKWYIKAGLDKLDEAWWSKYKANVETWNSSVDKEEPREPAPHKPVRHRKKREPSEALECVDVSKIGTALENMQTTDDIVDDDSDAGEPDIDEDDFDLTVRTGDVPESMADVLRNVAALELARASDGTAPLPFDTPGSVTEPAEAPVSAESDEPAEKTTRTIPNLDERARTNNQELAGIFGIAQEWAASTQIDAKLDLGPDIEILRETPAAPAPVVLPGRFRATRVDALTALGMEAELRTVPTWEREYPDFKTAERQTAPFPLCFVDGRHGRDGDPDDPLDQRLTPLSISTYDRFFLLAESTKALAADPGFFFTQLSDYMHLKAYQASQTAIQSRALQTLHEQGHEVTASHVIDQLERAVDDPELTLNFVTRNLTRTTLRAIPGSHEDLRRGHGQLIAGAQTLGPPQGWLTISFNDHGDPSLYRAIDRHRFPDQASVDALSSDEKDELLNMNAGIATRHYIRRCNAILAFLTSEGARAAFGGYKVTDWVLRHAEQKRRTLHTHFVLWFKGMPTYDTCPPGKMAEFLALFDECIHAEIPRPPADEHDPGSVHLNFPPELRQPWATMFLRKLIRRHNIHKHSATCRTYKPGRPQRYSAETRKRHEELSKAIEEIFNRGEAIVNPVLEGCGPVVRESLAKQKELHVLLNKLNAWWWMARRWCRFALPGIASGTARLMNSSELKHAQRGDRLLVPKR